EARYAFHPETESLEFGLSIDDRWQGQGIGSALMRNLECRAAAFGAHQLLGDTLRSNEAMIGLARNQALPLRRAPTTGSWFASSRRSPLRLRIFPAPAGGWPPRAWPWAALPQAANSPGKPVCACR